MSDDGLLHDRCHEDDGPVRAGKAARVSESKTPTTEEIVARSGAMGWAINLYNCTTGDNYLRGSEYVELIHTLDEAQLALEKAETDRAELVEVTRKLLDIAIFGHRVRKEVIDNAVALLARIGDKT
jgi:hypothetical protein